MSLEQERRRMTLLLLMKVYLKYRSNNGSIVFQRHKVLLINGVGIRFSKFVRIEWGEGRHRYGGWRKWCDFVRFC